MQEFFDRAENWDSLRTELFNESAALFAILGLVPRGLCVADIGTGTGGMLPYLAGILGDRFGMRGSFSIVPAALLLLMGLLGILSRRLGPAASE